MHPSDDDIHHPTEADHTSETRFGPRPVPPGHHKASSYAHRSVKASRTIPSAPMAPDGRSAYPSPALSTKIIVWGGVALGVAGATAGALMAVRKIAGMIGDDLPPPAYQPAARNHTALAPRFADLDEDQRDAMRRRARAQSREDRESAARQRAEAARHRNPPQKQGNFAKDLTRTANDLSAGLEGVAQSLSTAFDSFRSVASQASGIVSEFAAAADEVRSALHGDRPPRRKDEAPVAQRDPVPRKDDDIRAHRL